MDLIHQLAEEYSKKMTSPPDELLQENEAFTFANHAHAHMHSGLVQGKFLEMIAQMINPLKVLEIGTFTGFSALCLAKGLHEEGVLHTIELRQEDAEIAQQYFNKSGMSDKIKLHIGNAMDIIPALNETWDLVFIDADKVSYIDYYELTLPRLRKGGWMLADNVLFHGQVLQNPVQGKNAKAISLFNEHVAKDKRVEQLLLTLRDGLMLIRKL
jgi:caffeoyl-CoA O-methyltransferase